MHFRKQSQQRGFTLVEILVVLGIIIVIGSAIGVPLFLTAVRKSQVAGLMRVIATTKTAIQLYKLSNSSALPVLIDPLDAATPPVTGTLGGSDLPSVLELQTVLLTAKCLEAPIMPPVGSKQELDASVPLLWDTTAGRFFTQGDQAPSINYTSNNGYPRLLSSYALGGAGFGGVRSATNFSLDHFNPFPDGTRLVYWYFPGLSVHAAYEIALALDKGPVPVSASGTPQLTGPVIYDQPEQDGTVGIYVYVTTL
jgi:prepilin-type N-terminal cleavage/methylation domain-containing protein